MTLGDREDGRAVLWDGRSPACDILQDLLLPLAPEGTLRVAIQRLRLHEQGAPTGEHEVVDAVVDIAGNLVAVSMQDAVRADAGRAQQLDDAILALRADVEETGAVGADSLEIVMDVDGAIAVGLGFGVEIARAELTEGARHPALHDGAFHVRHSAPQLEELRERLAPPEPNALRRWWDRIRRR